jgi:hypothetical protein
MLNDLLKITETKFGMDTLLTLIETSLILPIKLIVLKPSPLKLFTNYSLNIPLLLLLLSMLENIVLLILGELAIIY